MTHKPRSNANPRGARDSALLECTEFIRVRTRDLVVETTIQSAVQKLDEEVRRDAMLLRAGDLETTEAQQAAADRLVNLQVTRLTQKGNYVERYLPATLAELERCGLREATSNSEPHRLFTLASELLDTAFGGVKFSSSREETLAFTVFVDRLFDGLETVMPFFLEKPPILAWRRVRDLSALANVAVRIFLLEPSKSPYVARFIDEMRAIPLPPSRPVPP